LTYASTARRKLRALQRRGFISLVEAGTQGDGQRGTASTWQWYNPPRPGKTLWNGVARMTKSQACEVADASESEHSLEPDPALDERLLLPRMLAPAQSQLADDASPWHKRSPEHLNSGVAIELPEQCTASTAHHAESDIENNAIETGGLSMEIDGRLTRELTEYAPSSQLKNSACCPANGAVLHATPIRKLHAVDVPPKIAICLDPPRALTFNRDMTSTSA
jgi:hypothetical protein